MDQANLTHEANGESHTNSNISGDDILANVNAIFSTYTKRPDLLLKEIEKVHPGFIKQLAINTLDISQKSHHHKMSFSKVQAYTSLFVQVVAAISLLVTLTLYTLSGTPNIWIIIGIGIVFAISQGGRYGFGRIATSIALWIGKHKKSS